MRGLHSNWPAVLGLVLFPIAAILVVLEIVGAIAGARHYLGEADLSSKRQTAYWIYFVLVGALGPVATGLIWFDPIRTGMTRRSRMALIGFVGTAIGLLAALLLLPY